MKLYNTLTNTVENFKPKTANTVKMYTCGLTVYSQPQIGNWVAYIYSDVLTRTLLASGFAVTRIQNITDVGHLVSDDDAGEDKMEKGARTEGLTAWDVADKYIKIAEKESSSLNLLPPTKLVRATDLIQQQIDFVQRLETKGYTYTIDDGVYFDTSKIDDYGKLARLDIQGLQAGARVAIGGKRNPTDFALWKFSPSDHKRDMEWESPWGKGFPGWHLECSVIARENLGDQIDLHTGGIDHIPVHHTNEIAQTETLTGKKPFSAFWFHNNHMKVNGTKLSKSLGNSFTLADIQEKGFTLDAVRILVLSSHYRTEGNFTWEILEAAQNRLKEIEAMADMVWQLDTTDGVTPDFTAYESDLLDALQDNLNTPIALSTLSKQVATIIGESVSSKSQKDFQHYLETIDSLLGLQLAKRPNINSIQQRLLQERAAARQDKDWERSDSIRNELQSSGLGVKDIGSNQIWFRL